MRHLGLLFYGLSFTSGCVSIGLCLLIYAQHRKAVVRDYALFLTSLALILSALILNLYAQLLGAAPPFVPAASYALDKVGALLFLFTGPFFFHRLLALEVTSGRRVAFLAVAGAAAALALAFPLVRRSVPGFAASLLLMYGMTAYCLVLVAVNLHRVGDATLRGVLRAFLLISLFFFPAMVLEVLRQRLAFLRLNDLFELFALPGYFFAINVLSVLLCFRYLGQPPFLAGRRLTDHFTHRFGITPREAEIIALLIRGKSYNDIADDLFISYKTVDNHVQNVYQKTRVRNRLQLLNLLQANRGP